MKSKKFKDVPHGEKWQFFRDYYLLNFIIGILIIVFISYIAWTIFKPKSVVVLNIAVFDENFLEVDLEEIENQILENMNYSENNSVVTINNTFYTNNSGIEKLQIQAMAGTIDLVIAPKETFEQIGGYGYFEVVSEKYIETQDILYCNGFKDVEEGSGVAKGELNAYGIYLNNSEYYREIGGVQDNAVVGTLLNAQNKENAEIFVDLLTN